MKWGIALGVLLLAAAAWPADAPPVRPSRAPDPILIAPPPPPPPSPAAETPPKPVENRGPYRGPEPGRPQGGPPHPPPPPEPPGTPRRTEYARGEVLGCVEDEAGFAIPRFEVTGRGFGHRRGRGSGSGTSGPGGTFCFQVKRMDFHLDEVPPGHQGSRTLFTIRADGYVARPWAVSEEDELTLRQGGRLTGVRIALEQAAIVEGRLFLPNGHPAPKLWVAIHRKKKNGYALLYWARADDEGWFRFAQLKSEPDLYAHASVRQKKPKRSTASPYIPLGDAPVPGEIIRIDLRLLSWKPGP